MTIKVGDLVALKSESGPLGVVTKASPNLHKSVSYEVWVSWNFLGGDIKRQFNWQLKVINKNNQVI